jgi:hypothetical protein
MLMPKAAVNENNSSKTRKHYVRRTWEILPVEAKTKAKAMCYASDLDLWRGMTAANPRHQSGPSFACQPIAHLTSSVGLESLFNVC